MALKRLEYSDYQLDIFDGVENGDENIAINAVAGSGKTPTIVAACKRLKMNERDVIFLAKRQFGIYFAADSGYLSL